MRIHIACDESGAKGKANQQEQYAGEVGVFAAILVSEENLEETTGQLEQVISPFRGPEGKLHITDLNVKDQECLRRQIYQVIEQLQLPCFWYAIHVQGFHANHQWMNELVESNTDIDRVENSHIIMSKNQPKPESLHAELFQGLYGNIIAFIEERNPGKVEINIHTDRVDKPIAKLFKKKADSLLDDSPTTIEKKAFDRNKNEVIKGSIRFETHFPDKLKFQADVSLLNLKIVDDSDPLVVAADILANSLNYHFKNRNNVELYSDLNRPSAISGHPLEKCLDAFYNWGGPDFADRMFRHPKAPSLEE